jgi:hypothetical protein
MVQGGLLDRVFDRSGKSASEVLARLGVYLTACSSERQRGKITEKTNEGCAKYLAGLKIHLFGNEDTEVTKEGVLALAVEGCRTDMLSLLVRNLTVLDFEARKDVGAVFGALVRVREGETDSGPGAVYVLRHPELLELLKCGCVACGATRNQRPRVPIRHAGGVPGMQAALGAWVPKKKC